MPQTQIDTNCIWKLLFMSGNCQMLANKNWEREREGRELTQKKKWQEKNTNEYTEDEKIQILIQIQLKKKKINI